MTLNYCVEGNGPPLLMLHGMGVTFSIWQNLMPYLDGHYTRIIVELPGHGASRPQATGQSYYTGSAQALETLRQSLGIAQWDILAYSIGAWAAHEYVKAYSQRVGRLTYLCPAVLPQRSRWLLRSLIDLDRYFPQGTNWILRGWRLHALVRLLGFGGANHAYAALWTREIALQPVETIKSLLRDLPNLGYEDLAFSNVSTRFIWGARDVVTQRPSPLRSVDQMITGSHSAPMLCAGEVASCLFQGDA